MLEILRDADQIATWTQAFVRVPSPQTDRMESEPAIHEFISGTIAPLLAQLGLHGRRDGMGNLIVELGPKNETGGLLLMAYAMTHPASSMRDPYSGAIVETEAGPAVRGRGAAEQKGALAAAVAAVEAAQKSGRLRGRLVFAVSTAGETGRHDAATSILSALDSMPPLGIVVLGTGSKVSLGNKGRIDFDVVIRGKAAHSSTPWLGTNAIDGVREVLHRLAGIELGGGRHDVLGAPSLTPTWIETAPKATHTVQDFARITFDRRLLPGDTPEPALAEIEAALAEIAPKLTIEVQRGAFMYPAEIQPDGPLLGQIMRGHDRFGLLRPDKFYSHGALDAGLLLRRGCEAAMWGPGDMALFHTDEERVPIAELRRGAEGYLALIASATCEIDQ